MEQIATPFAYYRGGSSKAVIVKSADLPVLKGDAELDAWILAAMGSPDRRQIDGMGGADPLTSKLAIVGPPSRPDADVDYTFFQVGIDRAFAARDMNCGNISAAIGPFAIDEGLVPAKAPFTSVRIHATNFGQIIHAEVPVDSEGRARVLGSQRVDGVPGTGAPVRLDMRELIGGQTGRLLPTGNLRDRIDLDGRGVDITIVDLANLVAYVRAAEIGLKGGEDPVAMENAPEIRERCERLRLAIAMRLGLASDLQAALKEPPSTPWLAVVSEPQDWCDFATGETHDAAESDILGRVIARRGAVHKAYPGTGSACLGVAAALEGGVVHGLVSPDAHASGRLRIGHPCGVLDVTARVTQHADGQVEIHQAAYMRTARRIADGRLYVALDRIAARRT
jgi:2-methylaconitate cis-trans-isomerase PrpF